MAITWSGNIEYKDKESRVDKYTEANNVKDIEKELGTLKKTVTANDSPKEVSATEEINFGTQKETWNKFFQDMDYTVEHIFDDYVKTNKDHVKELLKKWSAGQKELETEFDTKIRSKSLLWFDTYKATLEGNTIQQFKFQLSDLQQDVIDMITNENKESGTNTSSDNVFLNDKGTWTKGTNKETNKETKKYESSKDYLDPYKHTPSYANVDNDRKIENIYRDTKVKKVLERIFENEEGEEIHKRMFNINLDKEDGLAGVIIDIRSAITSNDAGTPNALYTALIEKNILSQSNDTYKLNFARSDFADLVDGGLLKYERKWGVFWGIDQRKKVANVLSRAKRDDLDTFASLVQSKDDVTMAVKEWNNTLEMTWNDREKIEKWATQTSLITEENVLEFLCDFNSDGQISAEYKRKNNKEQRNQWDVGVLFWQQVMFTLEQAIKVKTVELGEPKGEQVVISNIIKNMKIADSRNLENTSLVTMQKDPTKCTKENLAKLINGDVSEGIYPMPEMKIFFLDAIKKINGGSNEVQPDLYDTLVGKDADEILSLYESESTLKAKLDEILTQSKNPQTIEIIRKEWLVRVRETIFTKIMTAIDHVEITTSDGATTQLQSAWIDKWRETHVLKKELLESTIKSLIQTGIHYSETWGWRFMIGYSKEWISQSGRTKRARWVGWWVIIWSGKVELAINLSWEVAEQYNHKNVINANLSKVKSAKYVGIEWWALAEISTSDRWVDAEAYAGIDRQKDPVVGINQVDKQYRAVSEEIFDITWASTTTLADKTSFRSYILKKIVDWKNENVYGKFITNNEQHLTDNLDFMVRYMDANKFFGKDGILTKFPKANVTTSINALLDIIQSGNIESRRSDVIAWLHGKVALTKLSFGVTTNALTLKSWSWGWVGAPTATSNSGETIIGSGNTTTGNGGNESWGNQSWGNLGESRFGIAWLYIGLRISTWKNSYVPNVAQYLFTQYETGQGIGTEYINNPTKDLDKYGKYLIALYNDNRLTCNVDNWRLILTFEPQWSTLTLAKFLNIHATSDAQKWFSLRGNVLTIGNIGNMAAYTVTEAKGVRRMLCLGSKKMDDATRVTGDIWATNVDPMKADPDGYISMTKEKIDGIVNTMTGTWINGEVAKSETKMFFDAEGKLIKPANVKVTFIGVTEWQQLTTWTVNIQKNTDWTYMVQLTPSTPIDQLTITYKDQKEYDAKTREAILVGSNWKVETIAKTDIIKEFAMPDTISKVFIEQTEKTLSLFNIYKNTLYKDFMESILDAWSDAIINTKDYDIAFAKLKNILKNNSWYATLPDDFKTLIESTLSKNEKMLIVDKFKTIFSYVVELTNWTNDGANLERKITYERWSVYKTMKWPDGNSYPLTTDYRKMIVNNLKKETQLNREPIENLVGFTAFYKLNNKGRKYAMTPLGGTNVLVWSDKEQSMIPINNGDKSKAQAWFINNLKINEDNKNAVIDKIINLLDKNNIKVTSAEINKYLTDFLLGKDITIQSDVDSFKKINISTKRIFYLLGECGNESLGMQIEGVNISTFVPTEAKYTANGSPEKKYKNGMDLDIKSHSIASKVLTKEKRVGVKHHEWIDNIKNIVSAISNAWDATDKGNIHTWDGGNE